MKKTVIEHPILKNIVSQLNRSCEQFKFETKLVGSLKVVYLTTSLFNYYIDQLRPKLSCYRSYHSKPLHTILNRKY